MERGVYPVSAAEAADLARLEKTPRRKAASPALRPTRVTITVAAAASAICAAALLAAELGGASADHSASRAPVVTAAMVRHLASASRIALAQSGRAVIWTRQTQDGVSEGTSIDSITFSGRNWNDSFSEVLPGSAGQPATTQFAINRVVNGQAYDYFVANHGLTWYHLVGPNAISSMAIPDPRTLLRELSPDAWFVADGYSIIDGTRLLHLTATGLRGLPPIQLGNATPSGQLTALSFWVDRAGVVHRMSLTTRQVSYPGLLSASDVRHLPRDLRLAVLAKLHGRKLTGNVSVRLLLEDEAGKKKIVFWVVGAGSAKPQVDLTSMVVTFLDIGGPQVIRVPPYKYTNRGLG